MSQRNPSSFLRAASEAVNQSAFDNLHKDSQAGHLEAFVQSTDIVPVAKETTKFEQKLDAPGASYGAQRRANLVQFGAAQFVPFNPEVPANRIGLSF